MPATGNAACRMESGATMLRMEVGTRVSGRKGSPTATASIKLPTADCSPESGWTESTKATWTATTIPTRRDREENKGQREEERRRKPHKESRAGVLRRAGHVGDPEMAAGHLSLRGRHLHRRHRSGRGGGTGAQEGEKVRCTSDLRRRSARRIRPRFRLSDVPGQCTVRGGIPSRHVDRASADRQTSG